MAETVRMRREASCGADMMPVVMDANETTFGSLQGRPVLDRSGKDLGTVDDVAFDARDMRITGIRVKLAREATEGLHMHRPAFGRARLEVGVDRIGSVGDSVLLNVDRREIPGLLMADD